MLFGTIPTPLVGDDGVGGFPVADVGAVAEAGVETLDAFPELVTGRSDRFFTVGVKIPFSSA